MQGPQEIDHDLLQLKREVDRGVEALDEGDFTEYDLDDLGQLFDELRSTPPEQ